MVCLRFWYNNINLTVVVDKAELFEFFEGIKEAR